MNSRPNAPTDYARIRERLEARASDPGFLRHYEAVSALRSILDMARDSQTFDNGHDGMGIIMAFEIEQAVVQALGIEVDND